MEENKELKTEKQCDIHGVMHRLFRVLLMPLMILTLLFITVCSIVSIPLWILTGKTIIKWSCDLFTKHIEYCTNGA